MKYYVGLDVSVKETSVCIVNEEGDIIAERSVLSEPQNIADFLKRHEKTYERVGLEAGCITPWLYHALSDMGFSVICIDNTSYKSSTQCTKHEN